MTALALTLTDLARTLRTPLRQTAPVRIISSRTIFGGRRYGVRINGTLYDCNESQVAMLRAGHSPEALNLQPWQDEDEDAGAAWDRDASEGDRKYQFKREQEGL